MQHVCVRGTFQDHATQTSVEKGQFPFDFQQLHIVFSSKWDYHHVVLKFSQWETSGISPTGLVSETFSMESPRLIGFDSDWGDGNLPFLSNGHALHTREMYCSVYIGMVLTRKSGVMVHIVMPQIFLVLASFSVYAVDRHNILTRVLIVLLLVTVWALCRLATMSMLAKSCRTTTTIDVCQYGVMVFLGFALICVCIVASMHTYGHFAKEHGINPDDVNLGCFAALVFLACWLLLFAFIHNGHIITKRQEAIRDFSLTFRRFMKGCKKDLKLGQREDAERGSRPVKYESTHDIRSALRISIADSSAIKRPEPLTVGSIVDVQWEKAACGGRVVSLHETVCDVQLHDDGTEKGPQLHVRRSDLRSAGYTVPDKPAGIFVDIFGDPARYKNLPVGCLVEANYRKSGTFFKGRIAYSHPENHVYHQSYDIWFDSGVYERKVPCEHIVVLSKAPSSLGRLEGCVFSQQQTLGNCSFHFQDPLNVYVRFDSDECSSWRLDDGKSFPPSKTLNNCSFDSLTRTFKGIMVFKPVTWSRRTFSEYTMVFDMDFSVISSGQVAAFDSNGRILQSVEFGPESLCYERHVQSVLIKTPDGRTKLVQDVNISTVTVSKLKSDLEEYATFASSRIDILFQGSQLDDDKTLGDYDIADGSVLNLEGKDVSNSDRSLSHGGGNTGINDGNSKKERRKKKKKSSTQLAPLSKKSKWPKQVYVDLFTGQRMRVSLSHAEEFTVDCLKLHIERGLKIPVSRQRLSYKSHLLENGESLKEYGISQESLVKCIVQSKYFTESANLGVCDIPDKAPLFQNRCFEGEGRTVHILLLCRFDTTFARSCLERTGISVKIYESLPNLSQILLDPRKDTLWVMPNDGKEHQLSASDVEQICLFSTAGGGIVLWCDHAPLTFQSNQIMHRMGLGTLEGKYEGLLILITVNFNIASSNLLNYLTPKLGGKTVCACVEIHEPGFNGTHPITFGVTELYEGAKFARLPENLVASGWIKVLRSSEKHLVTAIRPPSNQAGPMIIHGACGQLRCHVDAAMFIGQEAFVMNMAAYSVLRPGDTSEHHAKDFKYYHDSLPPPSIGLERADERSPLFVKNDDTYVRFDVYVCVCVCVCVCICVNC
jgi:hypothetical protein